MTDSVKSPQKISSHNPKKPASQQISGTRWMSVDALRGFDMLWIVGAAGLVTALNKASGGRGILHQCAEQLKHKDWEGFAFYDLIFPLFVFIVGISLVFSLGRIVAQEGKTKAHIRLFRRALILFILGILYSGGFTNLWPDIRIMGVLQRLALCYLFGGLLFIHFEWRGLLAACLTLLIGYWMVMSFIPAPGQSQVSFAPDQNLANYIDLHFLPGRLHDKTWDPEGILSTFPAVATCLLGVFAGLIIQSTSLSSSKKLLIFIGGGAALAALGFLWGLQFPVIKKIWTSSYVLVAGGYSCMLLGVFYLIVDVWKFQLWARPLVWVGSNALAIYLARNIVDFHALALRFAGGNVQQLFGVYGDLVVNIVSLGFTLLLAWYLYRKQIFLRI
ncbi:MAG TPA: DUF5009 domain-containing protein [Candidatus Hydrogenedentes bacterium]|nr:DUF5009 domain-containing protein [Candidatus Hydrogenedentota bacterium]